MNGFPWLTAILLLPAAGALVLQLIPGRATDLIKGVTMVVAAAEVVLVAIVVHGVATTLSLIHIWPWPAVSAGSVTR